MSALGIVRRLLAVAAGAVIVGAAGTATAVAAPSSQDTSWMVAAHQNNLSEISAGKAAQQKASSQKVKDLGAMFVRMHTTLDADLTAAAATLGVKLPGAPSAVQQATLDAVSAKSGAAFDSAWVTAQLAGHRVAQQATQKEIAGGTDASVGEVAKSALPVIQQHLTSLESIAGSPSSVQAGTGGQAAAGDGSAGWVPALAGAGVTLIVGGALLGWRRRRA